MIIDNIIVEFDYIKISYYSFFYLLAGIVVFIIGFYRCKQIGIARGVFIELFFICYFGLLLGGRLGHVWLYEWGYYQDHLGEIWQLWRGGMSFHGALIGGALMVTWYAKRYAMSFFVLSDMIVLFIPIGILLGRIGNFLNNELWGKSEAILGFSLPTMAIKTEDILMDSHLIERVPIQLYEALCNGLLLFMLLWFMSYNKLQRGTLTITFLLYYGTVRAVLECFKPADISSGYILGIFTLGQLLSLAMIAYGGYLLYKRWLYARV